jgi:hypothetical protein
MPGTVGVISNPAGINPPGGQTAAENRTFTGVIAQYVAASAISAKQAVYLNTSLLAVKAATNTVRESVIGVAITDAAAGGWRRRRFRFPGY